jgi:tryptophan synthase alpha chain
VSAVAASRLRSVFAERRARGQAALVIYLTQGDPNPTATVDLVSRIADAGADVIELGVPFSDPNADGIVIQAAMQRALRAGGGLAGTLDCVARLRGQGCAVPIVLFGYYNPIFVFGADRFATAAAAAGVDAALVVDLPIEELHELATPLAAAGVEVVPLCAPTSGPSRIARLAEVHPPFVYAISMTGVTGAALDADEDLAARVAAVRRAAGAPVAVGFGISTPADARRVAAVADGVVVGSAVVSRLAGGGAAAAVAFVAELRRALDSD